MHLLFVTAFLSTKLLTHTEKNGKRDNDAKVTKIFHNFYSTPLENTVTTTTITTRQENYYLIGTYFSKFNGKVGVISWLIFHLI